MFENLIARIIGRRIGAQLEEAPAPGQPLTKTPWYKSKAKIGFILYIAATIIEQGSKLWGHEVKIPPEVFNMLEAAGLGIGGYGIRDAMKRPCQAGECATTQPAA